jgi:hypothetical protein
MARLRRLVLLLPLGWHWPALIWASDGMLLLLLDYLAA